MASRSSSGYQPLGHVRSRKCAIIAGVSVAGVLVVISLAALFVVVNLENSIKAPEVTHLEVFSMCDPSSSPFQAKLAFDSPAPFGTVEVESFQLQLHDSAGGRLLTSCDVPGFALRPSEANEITIDSAFVVHDAAGVGAAVSAAMLGQSSDAVVSADITVRWLGLSKSISISQSIIPTLPSSPAAPQSSPAGPTVDAAAGDSGSNEASVTLVGRRATVKDGSIHVPLLLNFLKDSPLALTMPPVAFDIHAKDGQSTHFGTLHTPGGRIDSEQAELLLVHTFTPEALPLVARGLITGKLGLRLAGAQTTRPDSSCALGQQIVQNVTLFDGPVITGQLGLTPGDIIDTATMPFVVPIAVDGNFEVDIPDLYWDFIASGSTLATLGAVSLQATEHEFTGKLALTVHDKDGLFIYLNNADSVALTISCYTPQQQLFLAFFAYHTDVWGNVAAVFQQIVGSSDGVSVSNFRTETREGMSQYGEATQYCASFTLRFDVWMDCYYCQLLYYGIDILYKYSPLVRPFVSVYTEYSTLSLDFCATVYNQALGEQLLADFQNNLVPEGITVVVDGKSVDMSQALGGLWLALGSYNWGSVKGASVAWDQVGTVTASSFESEFGPNGRLQNANLNWAIQFTPEFVSTIGSLPIVSSFESFGPTSAMPVVVNHDEGYVVTAWASAFYNEPVFSFWFQAVVNSD